MVRVMDERLDAKTLFYTGGDERNVAKNKPPVQPGVPAALGGFFKIEPVSLPPESWYPGMKPFLRREEVAKREQAVAVAEAAVKAAQAGDSRRGAEAQDPRGVEPGHGVQTRDVRACWTAPGVNDDHLTGELPGAAAVELHADGVRAGEGAFAESAGSIAHAAAGGVGK